MAKNSPLISVIVPVYNVEKHLKKCLNSLLLQTYDNLEIICVNDGSEDDSLKILKQYAKKDERIKIITQENSGQSHARNRGLEAAKGDYVSFVDSDDWISLTLYKKFVNALNSTDKFFDIYMFNYTSYEEKPDIEGFVNKNGLLYNMWTEKNGIAPDNVYQLSDCNDIFSGNMAIWNKIYKKELLDNIRFEENYIFEDQLFHIQTLTEAKGIYINPEVQYFYRQNFGSTLHSLGGNAFDIFLIQKRIRDVLTDKGLYDKYKYCCLHHNYMDCVGLLFKIVLPLKKKFYDRACENLKEIDGIDIAKVKNLHQSEIYFDMISLTYEDFMEKYIALIVNK